jgi:hypothetical protein
VELFSSIAELASEPTTALLRFSRRVKPNDIFGGLELAGQVLQDLEHFIEQTESRVAFSRIALLLEMVCGHP